MPTRRRARILTLVRPNKTQKGRTERKGRVAEKEISNEELEG